jgi:hypothetical protein
MFGLGSQSSVSDKDGFSPPPDQFCENRRTAGRNHRLKRAFWLAARGAVLHDPLAQGLFRAIQTPRAQRYRMRQAVARRISDMVYALAQIGPELCTRNEVLVCEPSELAPAR